jgi:hypothetical protein
MTPLSYGSWLPAGANLTAVGTTLPAVCARVYRRFPTNGYRTLPLIAPLAPTV